MAIIQFHTPTGIVEVNSDTVTDAELAALGVTRKAFNELLPKPITTYAHPKFIVASGSSAVKITTIETFLGGL